MLLDLEIAQILGRGRIRRASKVGSKTPHVADVLVLGSRQQTPHHHVMLHPLAQWRNRSIGGDGSHGKFLSVEGTRMLRRRTRPAQSLILSRYLPPRDPPAERVRPWRRELPCGHDAI